jgi:hypothetical protein
MSRDDPRPQGDAQDPFPHPTDLSDFGADLVIMRAADPTRWSAPRRPRPHPCGRPFE